MSNHHDIIGGRAESDNGDGWRLLVIAGLAALLMFCLGLLSARLWPFGWPS